MKKTSIITPLIAAALLLSACQARYPAKNQSVSDTSPPAELKTAVSCAPPKHTKNAGDPLDAIYLAYQTVVGTAPQEELTPQQKQALLDEIAKSGMPVAGPHTQNRNMEQVAALIDTVAKGESGELTVCHLLWQDRFAISRFTVAQGAVILTEETRSFSDESIIEASEAKPLGVFELRGGYLIYAPSSESLQTDTDGRGFRVEPLPQELVDFCTAYLDTLGGKSILLRQPWSPSDLSALNWDWTFEAVRYGQTGLLLSESEPEPTPPDQFYSIPGADVEARLTSAFPVTVEALRALPEYSSADQTYHFTGFRGGGYSPDFEITEVRKNEDNSLTFTVSTVSVEFGEGATPFCELTVLPNGDGTGTYLRNVPL